MIGYGFLGAELQSQNVKSDYNMKAVLVRLNELFV